MTIDARHPLPGTRPLVMGAARSGLAAARLLKRHGAEVRLADRRFAETGGATRAMQLRREGVADECVADQPDALAGRDLVVLSPGIPVEHPVGAAARARGIPVISELELGFLWYNCHPASVFMGDTGSLALGGALGTIAVLIKREFWLVLVGGVFVAETLSVMIQVASFRLWGRRVFKMSPLHHHFELMGWAESRVVLRFYIVGALLALLSLSTFKLQ